ncbi:MAG TPA: 50S ribosomal protein L21, partial [Planctomicrobium sp.]|nr:50S ribosomal protein L21 [Planctomicrobium sp.]
MFAIIEESGHQLRVQPGQLLTVDYREGAEVGSKLTFENVLLANGGGASQIGAPTLAGAVVEAEVVEAVVKGPKLEI